jgi:hypothetical protein
MARKIRLKVSEYANELPEGVVLKRIDATKSYQLRKGGVLLAERREEDVLMWKRPARVFAYIARRILRDKSQGAK